VPEPVAGRYPKGDRKPPEYLAYCATGNNFEDDSNDDQIMSTTVLIIVTECVHFLKITKRL